SFATISSGLYRFLAIAVLLDVKDIPQVGPLQWGRINTTSPFRGGQAIRADRAVTKDSIQFNRLFLALKRVLEAPPRRAGGLIVLYWRRQLSMTGRLRKRGWAASVNVQFDERWISDNMDLWR